MENEGVSPGLGHVVQSGLINDNGELPEQMWGRVHTVASRSFFSVSDCQADCHEHCSTW